MASKKDQASSRSSANPLDEYGVWVQKASVSDLDTFSDLPVADEPDEDAGDAPPTITEYTEEETLDFGMDQPGGLPEEDILTEREARLMGDMEHKKEKLADESEAIDISLDDSDELGLSDSDDLSDLSDLLMSIDEDTSEEETVFLEDEDMSLDLDSGDDDLLLETETSESPLEDSIDDDIVIPGLDDLNLDESLQVDSFDIPEIDGLSAPDEPSLDLPEESAPDSDELSLDVSGLDMDDGLDLPETIIDSPDLEARVTPAEEEDILGMADIPEEDLQIDSTPLPADDDLQLDMDIDMNVDLTAGLDDSSEMAAVSEPSIPDEDLDTSPMASEDVFDEPPLSFDLDTDQESPEMPADEAVITVGQYDEVASIENTFNKPEPVVEAPQPAGTSVLKSIEDELHAIRSELIDLRSELKRLRSKDLAPASPQSDEPEAPVAPPAAAGLTDWIPETEPAIMEDDQETSEDLQLTAEESRRGFFDDEEDETVALTGDELDNILNSAEFIEEEGEPSSIDETEADETEPDLVPPADTSASAVETFEDSGIKEEFSPIEEIHLEPLATETDVPASDSAAAESADSEVMAMASLDIEKELEGIDNLDDEDEDFEIFTGNDFSDLTIDIPQTGKESLPAAEATIDLEIEASDGTESVLMEPQDEAGEGAPEPAEPAASDSLHGVPELDLEPASLEAPEEPSAIPEDNDVSASLRDEIKAVLSYMDKLLESLPEEKIEEFARSEHFEVYKKLFDELGI